MSVMEFDEAVTAYENGLIRCCLSSRVDSGIDGLAAEARRVREAGARLANHADDRVRDFATAAGAYIAVIEATARRLPSGHFEEAKAEYDSAREAIRAVYGLTYSGEGMEPSVPGRR